MRAELLFQALGDIDEELVASVPAYQASHAPQKGRRRTYASVAAMAAALVVVVGLAWFATDGFFHVGSDSAADNASEIAEPNTNDGETDASDGAIHDDTNDDTDPEAHPNDDLHSFPANDQYLTIVEGGWVMTQGTVSQADLGEGLGEAEAISGALAQQQVRLYAIADTDPAVLRAGQVEGQIDNLVLVNLEALPDTLGGFVQALGLERYLTIGQITYTDGTSTTDAETAGELVWQYLLADAKAPEVELPADEAMDLEIALTLPFSGDGADGLGVTRDGTLVFSLFGETFAYQIEPSAVAAFMQALET